MSLQSVCMCVWSCCPGEIWSVTRSHPLYVHRLSGVFLASDAPFCHLVFFLSSFPHFSLSFFTSFLRIPCFICSVLSPFLLSFQFSTFFSFFLYFLSAYPLLHTLRSVTLSSFLPAFHTFLFLSLLPFCSLSEYGAPFRSETVSVFENSVLRVTLEQDEYPSRLVCWASKPTSWLELWLFPARLLNSECMTMMWRFCVFNLPRVNKTEPLYFYSLLLRLGITLLPLYSREPCPFRLSHRWQMYLI